MATDEDALCVLSRLVETVVVDELSCVFGVDSLAKNALRIRDISCRCTLDFVRRLCACCGEVVEFGMHSDASGLDTHFAVVQFATIENVIAATLLLDRLPVGGSRLFVEANPETLVDVRRWLQRNGSIGEAALHTGVSTPTFTPMHLSKFIERATAVFRGQSVSRKLFGAYEDARRLVLQNGLDSVLGVQIDAHYSQVPEEIRSAVHVLKLTLSREIDVSQLEAYFPNSYTFIFLDSRTPRSLDKLYYMSRSAAEEDKERHDAETLHKLGIEDVMIHKKQRTAKLSNDVEGLMVTLQAGKSRWTDAALKELAGAVKVFDEYLCLVCEVQFLRLCDVSNHGSKQHKSKTKVYRLLHVDGVFREQPTWQFNIKMLRKRKPLETRDAETRWLDEWQTSDGRLAFWTCAACLTLDRDADAAADHAASAAHCNNDNRLTRSGRHDSRRSRVLVTDANAIHLLRVTGRHLGRCANPLFFDEHLRRPLVLARDGPTIRLWCATCCAPLSFNRELVSSAEAWHDHCSPGGVDEHLPSGRLDARRRIYAFVKRIGLHLPTDAESDVARRPPTGLGRECIAELQTESDGFCFAICLICVEAFVSLEQVDEHLSSCVHQLMYLNLFHQDWSTEAKSETELRADVDAARDSGRFALDGAPRLVKLACPASVALGLVGITALDLPQPVAEEPAAAAIGVYLRLCGPCRVALVLPQIKSSMNEPWLEHVNSSPHKTAYAVWRRQRSKSAVADDSPVQRLLAACDFERTRTQQEPSCAALRAGSMPAALGKSAIVELHAEQGVPAIWLCTVCNDFWQDEAQLLHHLSDREHHVVFMTKMYPSWHPHIESEADVERVFAAAAAEMSPFSAVVAPLGFGFLAASKPPPRHSASDIQTTLRILRSERKEDRLALADGRVNFGENAFAAFVGCSFCAVLWCDTLYGALGSGERAVDSWPQHAAKKPHTDARRCAVPLKERMSRLLGTGERRPCAPNVRSLGQSSAYQLGREKVVEFQRDNGAFLFSYCQMCNVLSSYISDAETHLQSTFHKWRYVSQFASTNTRRSKVDVTGTCRNLTEVDTLLECVRQSESAADKPQPHVFSFCTPEEASKALTELELSDEHPPPIVVANDQDIVLWCNECWRAFCFDRSTDSIACFLSAHKTSHSHAEAIRQRQSDLGLQQLPTVHVLARYWPCAPEGCELSCVAGATSWVRRNQLWLYGGGLCGERFVVETGSKKKFGAVCLLCAEPLLSKARTAEHMQTELHVFHYLQVTLRGDYVGWLPSLLKTEADSAERRRVISEVFKNLPKEASKLCVRLTMYADDANKRQASAKPASRAPAEQIVEQLSQADVVQLRAASLANEHSRAAAQSSPLVGIGELCEVRGGGGLLGVIFCRLCKAIFSATTVIAHVSQDAHQQAAMEAVAASGQAELQSIANEFLASSDADAKRLCVQLLASSQPLPAISKCVHYRGKKAAILKAVYRAAQVAAKPTSVAPAKRRRNDSLEPVELPPKRRDADVRSVGAPVVAEPPSPPPPPPVAVEVRFEELKACGFVNWHKLPRFLLHTHELCDLCDASLHELPNGVGVHGRYPSYPATDYDAMPPHKCVVVVEGIPWRCGDVVQKILQHCGPMTHLKTLSPSSLACSFRYPRAALAAICLLSAWPMGDSCLRVETQPDLRRFLEAHLKCNFKSGRTPSQYFAAMTELAAELGEKRVELKSVCDEELASVMMQLTSGRPQAPAELRDGDLSLGDGAFAEEVGAPADAAPAARPVMYPPPVRPLRIVHSPPPPPPPPPSTDTAKERSKESLLRDQISKLVDVATRARLEAGVDINAATSSLVSRLARSPPSQRAGFPCASPTGDVSSESLMRRFDSVVAAALQPNAFTSVTEAMAIERVLRKAREELQGSVRGSAETAAAVAVGRLDDLASRPYVAAADPTTLTAASWPMEWSSAGTSFAATIPDFSVPPPIRTHIAPTAIYAPQPVGSLALSSSDEDEEVGGDALYQRLRRSTRSRRRRSSHRQQQQSPPARSVPRPPGCETPSCHRLGGDELASWDAKTKQFLESLSSKPKRRRQSSGSSDSSDSGRLSARSAKVARPYSSATPVAQGTIPDDPWVSPAGRAQSSAPPFASPPPPETLVAECVRGQHELMERQRKNEDLLQQILVQQRGGASAAVDEPPAPRISATIGAALSALRAFASQSANR